MTNKSTALKKLAAILMALTMIIGSFPVVYSEEEVVPENVTEATQEAPAEVTEPEPAPAAEPEPVAEPETVAEPEPDPDPIVDAEPAAEPEPVVETEPEPVAEPEPVVESEPDPDPIVDEEPAADPEPEADPNEVMAEISGTPAPELDEEPEDELEDDDWDDLDDDWDELDDFEIEDFGEDGEFAEFFDGDAGYIDSEILEQFNNPDYDQVEFSGSADIELKNEGNVRYGDEITLQAKVQDTDLSYRLVWEANDDDDRGWYTIGSGSEYSFTVTPENVRRQFRVVMFAVD